MRQLRRWSRHPIRVTAPWLALSLAIGVGLLLLVWLVAQFVPANPARPAGYPFHDSSDRAGHVAHLVQRNLVVLALHATACLAGYIVHAALRSPSNEPDTLERVTRATARVAIWWVPVATVLSIATQAWVLGSYASTLAAHLFLPVRRLLLTTAPHALLELTAVFLPLAAWLVALRARRLGELYAATIASVVIAVPMIVAAAWIEVDGWRDRVVDARIERPALEGVLLGTLVGDDPAAGTVQLELGDRVQGATFDSLESAVRAAARESAGRFGAVAVVQLGARHELLRIRRRTSPAHCASPAAFGAAGPAHHRELAGLRFVEISRSIPDHIPELDVDAIVDGDRAVDPAQLLAVASHRQRCTPGTAAGG